MRKFFPSPTKKVMIWDEGSEGSKYQKKKDLQMRTLTHLFSYRSAQSFAEQLRNEKQAFFEAFIFEKEGSNLWQKWKCYSCFCGCVQPQKWWQLVQEWGKAFIGASISAMRQGILEFLLYIFPTTSWISIASGIFPKSR
jgi:hypothetical protein